MANNMNHFGVLEMTNKVITRNNLSADTIGQALEEAGLNFEVAMTPAFAQIGDEMVKADDCFFPYRTDTKKVLGKAVRGHNFTPIQNVEAFATIAEMAKVADIRLENLGSWRGGAGVFGQISLGGDMKVGNSGDEVRKYLTLVNSHDGTKCLSLLITPYRLFCKNQIAHALASGKADNQLFKIGHGAYGINRLRELAETFSVIDSKFTETKAIYDRLAETKVNEAEVLEAFNIVNPYDADKCEKGGRSKTMWENKALDLIHRFDYADGGRTEKMSAWNLMNAIQGSAQHMAENHQGYVENTLVGSIAKKSADALELSVKVANREIKFTEHKELDRLFAMAV